MQISRYINGYECIFDDQDADLVAAYSWRVALNTKTLKKKPMCLAARSKGKVLLFHRQVLSAPKGVCVDHINGNPLDNRRENLRLADKSENARNRGADADNRSGFKGVYRHNGARTSNLRPWIASIQVRKVRKHLGCFETAEAAHAAYCNAAKVLHGEFAKF